MKGIIRAVGRQLAKATLPKTSIECLGILTCQGSLKTLAQAEIAR